MELDVHSGAATTLDKPDDNARVIELWLSLKVSPHTRRAYSADIARLIGFVPKNLARITLADLQAFKNSLEAAGLSPATQNRILTSVKSLLTFSQEIGFVPLNAGAALTLRPARDHLAQRILTEAEIARLIAAAVPGRDQTLLRFLYASGLRVSELCALRWSDTAARGEGGQVTVFGKGGKTRNILLKPSAWRQLNDLRAGAQPDQPVFRSSRKGGGPLDPSQVRRIVYRAAFDAGLTQRVSPHWMRHAHASHALDHQAPLHLVQATLGHASVATTGRYLHARPTESSGFYLPD